MLCIAWNKSRLRNRIWKRSWEFCCRWPFFSARHTHLHTHTHTTQMHTHKPTMERNVVSQVFFYCRASFMTQRTDQDWEGGKKVGPLSPSPVWAEERGGCKTRADFCLAHSLRISSFKIFPLLNSEATVHELVCVYVLLWQRLLGQMSLLKLLTTFGLGLVTSDVRTIKKS